MSASLERRPNAPMPPRSLILLAVLAGLLPAAASAADVRFAVRDEQPSADRSLQGLARTTPARRAPLPLTPPCPPGAGGGAEESIVGAPPSYAARLRLAVVHHTAGRNDYGPDESAAIVRGIPGYHVKGNGWEDTGYN